MEGNGPEIAVGDLYLVWKSSHQKMRFEDSAQFSAGLDGQVGDAVASTQVSALPFTLLAQFLAFRGAQAEIVSVSIGDLPIKVDRSAVADFCSQRGIRRLALFGSVLRQDFNPETSDVDVLADFQPGALRGLGLGYFDFGPDLSRILGHRVDFCSKLNRYIRPLVEREMLVIYEQP